jgi:hypothetical protein
MAHLSIGQEHLGFAVSSGSVWSLDDFSRLIGWGRIAVILGQVHARAKGESTSPPSPTTSNEHSLSCNRSDETGADTGRTIEAMAQYCTAPRATRAQIS